MNRLAFLLALAATGCVRQEMHWRARSLDDVDRFFAAIGVFRS